MKTHNRILTMLLVLAIALLLFGGGASAASQLLVHYIDVGQADAILIQTSEGENVLIDGGNNDDGNLVASYLKQAGVKKLAAVIATHPHEDHIGGLDTVLNAYRSSVEAFYMPLASHTTKSFRDLVTAAKESGAKRVRVVPGLTLNLTTVKATFLAPQRDSYDELNDYSAVLRLEFGSTSFLFPGDAEGPSEAEMLASGSVLSSTVLKVGHHGGRTSSTQAFLEAVKPTYAIISVGLKNDYGHPHKETLERLKAIGTQILRTDQSGTIIVSSDGTNITVKGSKGPALTPSGKTVVAPVLSTAVTVYITRTGDKYHLAGCRYLARSQIPISLKEARNKGYGPCSACNPPVK